MPEKIQNYTVSDRIWYWWNGYCAEDETGTKADVAVKSP